MLSDIFLFPILLLGDNRRVLFEHSSFPTDFETAFGGVGPSDRDNSVPFILILNFSYTYLPTSTSWFNKSAATTIKFFKPWHNLGQDIVAG